MNTSVVEPVQACVPKRRGRSHTKMVPVKVTQSRFFLDYTKDSGNHAKIVNILSEINSKARGREVTFKEVVDILLDKITPKDIEHLRENSLTGMDRIHMMHEKFNEESEVKISIDDFITRLAKNIKK